MHVYSPQTALLVTKLVIVLYFYYIVVYFKCYYHTCHLQYIRTYNFTDASVFLFPVLVNTNIGISLSLLFFI